MASRKKPAPKEPAPKPSLDEESLSLDPAFDPLEDERETSLRPKVLAEFQGQARLKENLSLFISAAREREEALDHLFLMGPQIGRAHV